MRLSPIGWLLALNGLLWAVLLILKLALAG